MSLLDKINESISDLDNIKPQDNELENQLASKDLNNNIQENKILKKQLIEATRINNRNIEEINELKDLIKNYNSQLSYLKLSYEESIQNLKAQLDFEKEINERYLSKIVKSNNELKSKINNFNNQTSDDNKQLLSLLNKKQQDDSSEDDNFISDELKNVKDLITKNNKDVKKLINKINEETISSRNELIEEVSGQQNNLKEYLSRDNSTVIEDIIKDNFSQMNDVIVQSNKKRENDSSMFIEKIGSISSISHENLLDNIQTLILDNIDELDNSIDKIYKEISNISSNSSSDDLINKISQSIKTSNEELINGMYDNSILIKMDILNRISEDLRNGNYINFDAYHKIRDLNLFDEVYYRKSYGYDLDLDPLLHYIYIGYKENKNPSEHFDTLLYKNSHENIKKSTLNPLVYFVTNGINEGNIKINDDLPEIKHINKYDVDNEIENFTLRGVKKNKRKPRLIVSLSSIPEHIHDLQYTLYSLLNQQLKADKVILWLNEDDYPKQELDLPRKILQFKENGLSIRFCENYRKYNTIIPVLNMYPKDIIITANDNVYYPENWLKNLYEDYKNNPDTIIAHKSKIIITDKDNNPEKYNEWNNNTETLPSYHNFAITEAGVLYPPNTLYPDLVNKEKFTEYEDNVDVWLWAMTIINHKKIKLAENNLDNELTYVNPIRKTGLLKNTKHSLDDKQEHIDITIKNIVNKYSEIKNIINEE